MTIAAGLLAVAILGGATVKAWRHGWPLPVVSLFSGQAVPGAEPRAASTDPVPAVGAPHAAR